MSNRLDFHPQRIKKKYRINKDIRERQVQLVQEGKKPENMSFEDAMAIAEEQSLDLVEINPNTKPVLCKLMDYGKFLYKKRKQEQVAKKSHQRTEMKTIRFGYRTSEHDLAVREKNARKFLEKGNIVKIQVIGRGRELAYKSAAVEKVKNFIAHLEDVATVDTPPKTAGNTILAIIKPIK